MEGENFLDEKYRMPTSITPKQLKNPTAQAGIEAAGGAEKVIGDTQTGSQAGKIVRRQLFKKGGGLAKLARGTHGLGTALAAGAAIGDWMNKNLDQNVSTSGRGEGRGAFKGGGTITK